MLYNTNITAQFTDINMQSEGMKWYFNKRLVHTRANGSKKNMFLFQQNWIKDIVVNINRIGITTEKMFVPYR